jgi:hypothetical protein
MDQTAERFLLVETIVTEVLDAPEELRAELIETRCRQYPTLVREVCFLLDACNAEEQPMVSCRLDPRVVCEEVPKRNLVGPGNVCSICGRLYMG